MIMIDSCGTVHSLVFQSYTLQKRSFRLCEIQIIVREHLVRFTESTNDLNMS